MEAEQREGLGENFIEAVQQVIDAIAKDPLRYPIVWNNVREGPLSDFPFAVYYRIKSNRIVIISIFHSSRDPTVWQSRN